MHEQTYLLPEPTKVTFFRDGNTFAGHVEDHFLSDDEPWFRVLGVDLLRRCRRRMSGGDPHMQEELYQAAVAAIDSAIRWAAGMPLYAEVDATCRREGHPTYGIHGYWFIAPQGFVVIVLGGVVRTAYFCPKTANDSYYTLFLEAWKSSRTKLLSSKYYDSKDRRMVEWRRVRMESAGHWKTCPNPHRPPRRVRPLRPEVEAWIEDVEALSTREV